MLPLLFFTTNNVKLAHVRYLGESYRVKIEGFRQKTYHASYNEPRISSRDDLLRESYESAIEQAKKAHIDTTRRFFFLEDTSVILEALSTKHEVPGVDVKYWMANQTFASLDEMLRANGNNRKVFVRSDMVLHIPEIYRTKWGLTNSYIIFTGTQSGSVSEVEHRIETNLVYPWLDDRTFNKWFIPDDVLVPLSLLPIDDANTYDFRKKAFAKMMDFLAQKGALTEAGRQMNLSLQGAPLLIVCGFTCAGKTTISQYLLKAYGYRHIEASDFMYLNFYLRHDPTSKTKIGDFAEQALHAEPQIAAKDVAKYMESDLSRATVISGFRSMNEIDWLTDYFKVGTNATIVFIQATERIRFERHKKRNRDKRELSEKEFSILDQQQIRMGLEQIERGPGVILLKNEGDLDGFLRGFETTVLNKKNCKEVREIDLSRYRHFKGVLKLEDAILIALLGKWDDSENRKFFTTTGIAKLIREIFPEVKPVKHKDNVSRYFNQDFYPLYEIAPSADESKRRYRLSNTGYGRAVDACNGLTI
jgi:dephospho-CoA kinase/inosine/xanthosine triphosphate pyrophosphatase family protein